MEKTFGQRFNELKGKLAEKIDVRELHEARRDDFFKNLFKALERGAAQFAGDFFISVLVKREELFDDMFHFYFIPRETAPYPVSNTLLFFYDHKKDDLDIWWALPSMETCRWFMTALEAQDKNDPELYGTYLMIKDFYDEVLDTKVTNYNDSITESKLRSGFNPADYDDGDLVVRS